MRWRCSGKSCLKVLDLMRAGLIGRHGSGEITSLFENNKQAIPASGGTKMLMCLGSENSTYTYAVNILNR